MLQAENKMFHVETCSQITALQNAVKWLQKQVNALIQTKSTIPSTQPTTQLENRGSSSWENEVSALRMELSKSKCEVAELHLRLATEAETNSNLKQAAQKRDAQVQRLQKMLEQKAEALERSELNLRRFCMKRKPRPQPQQAQKVPDFVPRPQFGQSRGRPNS